MALEKTIYSFVYSVNHDVIANKEKASTSKNTVIDMITYFLQGDDKNKCALRLVICILKS